MLPCRVLIASAPGIQEECKSQHQGLVNKLLTFSLSLVCFPLFSTDSCGISQGNLFLGHHRKLCYSQLDAPPAAVWIATGSPMSPSQAVSVGTWMVKGRVKSVSERWPSEQQL